MTYSTASALIAHLVTLAGTDLSWDVPSARPTSREGYRAGLMTFLYTASQGICAFCGEDMAGEWNVCHIVSGGRNRRGWIAGNVVAGCADCNQTDQTKGFNIVPASSILRFDLIPQEWPSVPELKTMGSLKAEAMKRKAAKRGI